MVFFKQGSTQLTEAIVWPRKKKYRSRAQLLAFFFFFIRPKESLLTNIYIYTNPLCCKEKLPNTISTMKTNLNNTRQEEENEEIGWTQQQQQKVDENYDNLSKAASTN
jgi:hypothetical protein